MKVLDYKNSTTSRTFFSLRNDCKKLTNKNIDQTFGLLRMKMYINKGQKCFENVFTIFILQFCFNRFKITNILRIKMNKYRFRAIIVEIVFW